MLNPRCASALCGGILIGLLAAGCSEERDETLPPTPVSPTKVAAGAASEPDAPSGLVSIALGGESIDVWPFTGSDFGTASDPLNLVFAGNTDARRIRAALLSLDGNRPGFPPVYPFNQRWSDAMGGVQTAYADGDGWLGSVIQLQLGTYGPVRFHLRLFDTRSPFGENGTWTLGGAHFEILIPGTADHQVISWELAERLVMADLVRSGLLGGTPAESGPINPAPGYRTIPPPIYNGIPDGLKMICGLPPGPSATPVPIPTNGKATLLTVIGEIAGDTGEADQEFTLQYRQIIPRPFCSGGPLDFLLVEGPVSLHKEVLDADGRYEYSAEIRGQLLATPVDVTKNPPVPSGAAFRVSASDVQHGFLDLSDARVAMQSNRIVFEEASEKQFIHLVVHEKGTDSYREQVKCLTE